MTRKQNSLYWREWQAVRVRCKRDGIECPDRHELHRKALDEDKSHEAFSNGDFDLVLAEFRALSRPDSVDSQLRQQNQPRARSLHKIGELMICLEVYVPDAMAYVREIIRDKFNRGSARQVSEITDLSDSPAQVDGPSQLRQLIMTLERNLNGKDGFRARAGDSVHDMLKKAGLKCECTICVPKAKLVLQH